MSRMLASIALGLALFGANAAAQEPTPQPPEPMPTPTPMPEPIPMPEPSPMPEPTPSPYPQAGQMGRGQGNDANVLAAVIAANEAEVNAAEVAIGKTENDEVREFAEMMQRDHRRMGEEARTLSRRITDAPNEDQGKTRGMKREAESELRRLRGMEGAAFDRAYIEAQVAAHENVLQEIERGFLPKVENAELRRMLESARTTVREHLNQARQLSGSVSMRDVTGRNPM